MDSGNFSGNKIDIPKPKRSKSLWWVAGVIVILILILLVPLAFSSSTIVITPRSETANILDTLVVASPEGTEAELNYKVMVLEGSASIEVPASGIKTVERKASGQIKVLNNHSESAMRLIKNTRFRAPNGKVYRVQNAISVPGKTSSGPGELTITVYADEAGEEYNLSNAIFTVPGLAGTDQYNNVSAEVLTPITGGFAGEVKVVSDSDLATAETALEKSLTDKLLTDASAQVPEGNIFFKDGYSVALQLDEYADTNTNSDSDASVSMDGQLYVLLFDELDLSAYIAQRELSNSPEANVVIENWDELSFHMDDYEQIVSASDLDFTLTGQAKFVWTIDQNAIKSELAGLKKGDSESIFAKYPGVASAIVNIKPMWKRSFPSSMDKIDIEMGIAN